MALREAPVILCIEHPTAEKIGALSMTARMVMAVMMGVFTKSNFAPQSSELLYLARTFRTLSAQPMEE
jgi:hypothetical protein